MKNRVWPVLYLTVSVMRHRLRAGAISAVAVLVLVSPRLAWACSVCASGREEGARQTIQTPGKASATYFAAMDFPLKDDDPDYPALVMGDYILGSSALSSSLSANRRFRDAS